VNNFKSRCLQFAFANINLRLHNAPDLFGLDRPVGSKAKQTKQFNAFPEENFRQTRRG
jgi:hypothetical protein